MSTTVSLPREVDIQSLADALESSPDTLAQKGYKVNRWTGFKFTTYVPGSVKLVKGANGFQMVATKERNKLSSVAISVAMNGNNGKTSEAILDVRREPKLLPAAASVLLTFALGWLIGSASFGYLSESALIINSLIGFFAVGIWMIVMIALFGRSISPLSAKYAPYRADVEEFVGQMYSIVSKL